MGENNNAKEIKRLKDELKKTHNEWQYLRDGPNIDGKYSRMRGPEKEENELKKKIAELES